jgi:hypothetical protein
VTTEIKLELDTKKWLCRVLESTKFSQLAAANAFALIAIVAILYGPHPAPKKSV